jgi:competence protein ComEA
VRKPGVYTLDATSRIQDIIEKAGGASDDAALDELNLAAKLLDGTTLHVPVKPVWDPRSRQFVFTTPQGPSYNPPQYTRSGWADAQSTANPTAAPTKSSEKGAGLINLNTATQEQLESLPGVGPKLAQQIMAQRASTPFRTVDDLDKVPGFGPRRIDQIRGLVTVR